MGTPQHVFDTLTTIQRIAVGEREFGDMDHDDCPDLEETVCPSIESNLYCDTFDLPMSDCVSFLEFTLPLNFGKPYIFTSVRTDSDDPRTYATTWYHRTDSPDRFWIMVSRTDQVGKGWSTPIHLQYLALDLGGD